MGEPRGIDQASWRATIGRLELPPGEGQFVDPPPYEPPPAPRIYRRPVSQAGLRDLARRQVHARVKRVCHEKRKKSKK